MTTYTINNTTANTGTITVGGLSNQPLGNIVIGGGLGGSGSASQVYTTATGSSGQFLTGAGSNGMSWTTGTVANPYDAALTIKGNDPATLEVKGNLVLNGQDLEERLKTIEKVLTIPERDVKLEKKHPKLKKLYDEYIAALGKYRTFEAIKGEE
jgi:hypothetical protein